MGKKWNQNDRKPVIDTKGAGGPSTTGKKSGDDRANVVPKPPASTPPKKKP